MTNVLVSEQNLDSVLESELESENKDELDEEESLLKHLGGLNRGLRSSLALLASGASGCGLLIS